MDEGLNQMLSRAVMGAIWAVTGNADNPPEKAPDLHKTLHIFILDPIYLLFYRHLR
jgi:hypothetical protein